MSQFEKAAAAIKESANHNVKMSDDELLLISTSGVVIRMAVREIASQGRDATGVRVMNLGEGDAVAAVAPVAGESGDDA